MRRGYTSSYTSGDPTHPLDPRKIFSRSFWPDPPRSKRSATASTSEDLIWATTAFSFHVLLSSSSPFSSFFSSSTSPRTSFASLVSSRARSPLRSLSDGLSYPPLAVKDISGRVSKRTSARAVDSFYRDVHPGNRPALERINMISLINIGRDT